MADDSSAILAALEGSGIGNGIYCRVASFLLPFGDLVPLDLHDPTAAAAAAAPSQKEAAAATATAAPTKKKKRPPAVAANKRTTKKEEVEAAVLRSLAKRFLPFLSRALKLLPSVLRKCPREEEQRAGELFAVYRLVLDCLACVAPCLDGKPFSVHLQRCSLLRCLETWGKYAEAEQEGVSLLESLLSLPSSAAPKKPQKGRTSKGAEGGNLLPDPTMEGANDEELAILVVESVASLIRCAYKSKTKDGTVYRRVLLMVEEVQPWLRVLESEAFEKYQSALVNALCKCSLFLAGECMSFDADLVYNFCLAMSRELLKSSSVDQFPKIARQVCSSICSQWESRPSLMLEMLRCSLDSIFCKCKVDVVYITDQVLEFVRYIVDDCRRAKFDVQKNASELFYEWRSNLHKVSPPVASVLGIYAIGLNYTTRNMHVQLRDAMIGCSNDTSVEPVDNTEHLQTFSDSLDVLVCYFHNSDGEVGDVLARCARKVSSLTLECKSSKSCSSIHGEVSFLSYLDALGFLCNQLEEYISTSWKKMIHENKTFHSADINYVQDAFLQFCDLFLHKFRCNDKCVRERLHESRLILIRAAVASLKISLVARDGTKRTVTCIDHVISCDWIELPELKYLASLFYNIGASLYNIGQVDKAAVALQLCCTTLWTHVTLLCQLFPDRFPVIYNVNTPEDVIKDAIVDACAKSALAVDVIHQCGNSDVHNIVVNSLLSWSVAEEVLERLTGPLVLVKQWVKILCKDFKDVDAVDSVPVLYPLLLSKCLTLSKRTLGIILEQELLAYEELELRYPNLCRKMQLRLTDMLLMDIYVTEEYLLPRSKILVKKGLSLRNCRLDGLKSSLQHFSEAISLLEAMCSDTSRDHVQLHYQLALTYFLHAHCAQEASQNMEVILHDIGCALRYWSSISESTHFDLEYEKTVQLLCGIADLVALKGHLHFQLEICKLIIVLSERKNVPHEKCVHMLWNNRRLSHAYCSSPIDQNFVFTMSEELGIPANTISFWMSCMKCSPSSLVGFLQRFMLSDSIFPQVNIFNSENSLDSQLTVEEVKKAASSLTSSVPVASHSAFAAGYLFFDLSERLFSVGQLYEALSYAREALRLRKKILQRKFTCSLGQQPGIVETIWNNGHKFTKAMGSVITEDWPNFTKSQSVDDCIISPWGVLRCYLESVLQVGILYESIGNGLEAENFLRVGKTISCSWGFPILGIAFSSHLGQVYRKKQHLDLAVNELKLAKKILLENSSIISCKHCRVALEATIYLQMGDIYRSIFESTSRIQSINRLSNALSQYKSAVELLNLTELGSSFGTHVKTKATGLLFREGFTNKATNETCHTDEVPLSMKEKSSALQIGCARTNCYINGHPDGLNLRDHPSVSLSNVESEDSNVDVGGRRKPKLASKHRSRKQTSNSRANLNHHYKNDTYHSHDRTAECAKKQNVLEFATFTCKSTCPHTCHQEGAHLEPGEALQQIYECNEASTCTKRNCWRCFLVNVAETGSMDEILYVKWECHRRCLLLRLLSKIGKCMGVHRESHEVHEIFWQSMSLLFNREPHCHTRTPSPCLIELVGIENLHDIFPIQRAILLYNMGLFCIKDCFSEEPRTCCSLSKTQIPGVLSWLLTAFIVTQETPLLFQKVSRLIAAILILSMSTGHFSFPFSFGSLTGSHLAAFFHQASIGTYLQHMYISSMEEKGSNVKDFLTGGLTDRIASSGCIRVAPGKLSDLEDFVNNFFKGLPSFTVICISFLGRDYINLFGETLLLPSFFPSWMMLSRLDLDGQPIVMLLPVNFIPEEIQDDANYNPRSVSENMESITKWECPWGHTLVDYVAPQYKVILEENYLSLLDTTHDAADTQRKRFLWWSERTRLDNHLSRFLRNMEDSWLGPWRCLLLGECSDHKHLDSVLSRLSQYEIEANTSILKAILGGSQSLSDIEACISQLLLYRGHLGRGGCCQEESFRAFSPATEGGANHEFEPTRRLILEAIGELVQENIDREPIVLVLDTDLQMLPWENMPILRKQEVYRMPSMSCISATLYRYCHHDQARGYDALIPSVDPLNAYYLLNPSGDLQGTQIEFEEWFKNQKWEGKAGVTPTTKELADALQSHDLFLYFGHGSGTQYIHENAIQKLDHCAATLLMGCSSGSFFLRGCYAPHGAPISYLLAGSLDVIANLWEVSDKDIDRFGKAMLSSWLQEPTTTDSCTKCNGAMQECGCLDIDVGRGNGSLKARRKAPRDKKLQGSRQNICKKLCAPNRIASFMSQARDVCKLPSLIGASPVCYGIPTLIRSHRY